MKVFKAFLTILSIVITLIFLLFTDRFELLYLFSALLCYILSSAIHLLAHEFGHFIGGISSGYTLLCLKLGPLNIILNRNRKVSLHWKSSLSGQCIMIPKKTLPVRYAAYNLGGIIANLAIITLSFILLIFSSYFASLLLVELLCVGVQKVLINSIPHKTNSIPNDGYIVKLLNNSLDVQKDYSMYLNLYGKLFFDEKISAKEFTYDREITDNEDEMIYYNEIKEILSSQETADNNISNY